MENIHLNTAVSTNVKILVDGKVAVDKSNAIHPANMATVIARGLSNAANHQIFKIKSPLYKISKVFVEIKNLLKSLNK